ncbi:MAG: PD-(D/E)XK nuclease family protein [Ignavibacteriaceae bacterium]
MILTKNKIDSIDPDCMIDEKIKSGKLDDFLLIIPTNRKIRSLKREIISKAPGQASGKINLQSIGTFAGSLLFTDGNMKAETLSEAASTVLLKQSLDECKLKYFSAYKDEFPHGTLIRLREVISEYKKNGITPGKLLAEAGELEGSEKSKAVDIAGIYEAYQAKCRQLNVKETGDIYFELNGLPSLDFEKKFRMVYPLVNLIIIDGFNEFTVPEIEIINTSSIMNGIDLYISFDYYTNNRSIFSHLDKCYDKLIQKGFQVIKNSPIPVQKEFEGEIKENLFKLDVKNKIGSFSSSITKIVAGTREKEIELIAKEIKELITFKKAEPNRICVVFNLIQKYSNVIRDIFQLYGLPFNLTDRIPLDSSSPVISIINLLEILENDFYYRNIFRALSGGYLIVANLDKSNLLKASVNLKIISGYDNWINTLRDALVRIEEGDNDEYSFNSNNKEIYQRALSDLESLHKILLPFQKMMTLKEFADNLYNLIFSLQFPAKLVNNAGSTAEENVKGITTFLDLIKEIFNLFELEFGVQKKFPLNFFLSNLKTAVTSSRFNIKEKPGYGIQVTNLEEIRGLRFDYLFISGLCDGDLPTRYSPEIFFSGSYQKNDRLHQIEERYRFYQSLCSWSVHLYLTYPLHEEKKELVESNFLNEFGNLFDTELKNETDYSDSIYSREELMIYLSQNKFEGLPQDWSPVETGIDYSRINKSLGIDEIRRSKPFGKSEYTGSIGNILNEQAGDKLSDLKFREFSISQLETYALCPYKYMAERILKLKALDEPTEDIEALEMGSLLHNILYKFYKQIREKGIILAEADEEHFKFAEKFLFEIAEKIVDDANLHSPLAFYEKEKVLGVNGDRKNSILYKFLQEERNNKEGFIPEYFEFNFGGNERRTGGKETLQEIKIDSVSVVGKIDRIDIDKGKKKFKVIDYKLSGKKPSVTDLQQGISLQLPLYLYAARQLINIQLGNVNNVNEPVGAEIYSLKFSDKEFGSQLVKLLPPRAKYNEEQLIESYKEMIDICLDAIKKYVDAISKGNFNLSTLEDRENKVCKFCSFRAICRIQDIN